VKTAKAMKLTVEEKQARGTHQPCRDFARGLDEIRQEVSEVLESLEDMRYNLREAGKAIRKEGVLIPVITRSNDNKEVRTKKLNPACKLQREMLVSIKSAKRALVLLRDEESQAARAAAPIDNDFEGLE
jgi:hypothetical protein